MQRIRLNLVDTPFHYFNAVRVQQGETSAGAEAQLTLLRTCICIGFYHAEKRIGAISHITGFSREGAHYPTGALNEMERKLGHFGLSIKECSCFVAGGSDRNMVLYEEVQGELKRRGIVYENLDVLGLCHRKLLFEPATGEVTLYKKTAVEKELLTRDSGEEGIKKLFHDPKRRLATGATVLFRNRALLTHLREVVLPQTLGQHGRFHVWCAGCSIGMESYSVAMTVLDWMDTHGIHGDVKILGTDISDEALMTASVGEYPVSVHSVRDYAPYLSAYTESLGNHVYRMGPRLRSMVLFRQHDIRMGSRRHRFEFVICDHVFQYFGEDVQKQFLESITEAVQRDGFLYVSTPSARIAESITREYPYQSLARHFYRRRAGF